MEPGWPIPIHCPIDRVVLREARITGAWTKLDDIDVYKDWVFQLREFAASKSHSLAEWELLFWNRQK